MAEQLCELASLPMAQPPPPPPPPQQEQQPEVAYSTLTDCRPWATSVTQQGSQLLSSTLESASTIMTTYSPLPDGNTTSTSTAGALHDNSPSSSRNTAPKRRRKEDAVSGIRRYSPAKVNRHLREQTGSLLDDPVIVAAAFSGVHGGVEHCERTLLTASTAASPPVTASYMMEDDDQSQLAGASIPLYQQQPSTSPTPYHSITSMIHHSSPLSKMNDDLSYTYSESEASHRSISDVAKDLMQELIWEKLNDEEEDKDQTSYGGESYDSSPPSTRSHPTKRNALTLPPPSTTTSPRSSTLQRSNSSSLVGEVITVSGVADAAATSSHGGSDSSSKSGNNNDNVNSTRFMMTTSRPKVFDGGCRRVSDCSSNDSEATSSCGDSVSLTSQDLSLPSSASSSSEGTDDSDAIDGHRPIRLRSSVTHNKRPSSSYTAACKKRKEQASPSEKTVALSPSRVHDRNRARIEEAYNPFLFPLQHLTDSLTGSMASSPMDGAVAGSSRNQRHSPNRGSGNSNNSAQNETSILGDLTQDLKEIAIIAGKSSESLVINLYHTLCEE